MVLLWLSWAPASPRFPPLLMREPLTLRGNKGEGCPFITPSGRQWMLIVGTGSSHNSVQ